MKLTSLIALMLSLFSNIALAHERWVEHDLMNPIDESMFSLSDATFQSLLLRTLSFAIAIVGVWVLRQRIAFTIETHLPKLKNVSNFVFKSRGIFNLKISKTIEDAALRLPALVLIYSAAGGYLIMPSFPVAPEYMNMARFAQALLAVMIVADICLPLVGLGIFGVIGIIFAEYGAAAIDVLPVAGVAYLYVTTKVRHHHFLLKAQQIRVTRVIIGTSFFALGIMKILRPEIIVGVVDHYNGVMHDPMILPFWLGTDLEHSRECWAIGFACSEMLVGGLIALGIFSRALSLIGAFVFAKLMLSSFGWLEFPHIFPISCLLLVALHPSRRQKDVLQKVVVTIPEPSKARKVA